MTNHALNSSRWLVKCYGSSDVSRGIGEIYDNSGICDSCG